MNLDRGNVGNIGHHVSRTVENGFILDHSAQGHDTLVNVDFRQPGTCTGNGDKCLDHARADDVIIIAHRIRS